MKEKFWHIISSVNTIGIFVLIAFFTCSKPPQNTIEKTVHYIYDSTDRTPPAKTPPQIVTTKTVPVPVGLDSAQIAELMRAFFLEKHYSQEFADSNVRSIVTSTVFQNTLINQQIKTRWLAPVKTIESTTITNTPSTNATRGLYLGAFMEFENNGFAFGPKVSFKTKKDLIIGYDLGLRPDPQDKAFMQHRISLQQKIKW